jgi:hypothetical protein
MNQSMAVPMQPQQITTAVPQILICPHCEKPTYFEGDKQMPGVAFGDEVKDVPESVVAAYREARNCMTVSAHTASALMSRKLLMNIAADHGAREGLRFVEYIDYLDQNGFIPPNGKAWVDHIKDKGNEATHKIPSISKTDAEDLIIFVSTLLRFIYEFPNRISNKP